MRPRLVGAATAVVMVWLPSVSTAPGAASAAPRVVLPGTAAPAVPRAQRLGEVPADHTISVAVSLKLRDTAGLDRFLEAVATPGTPEYGHYLTPERFLARYGPTQAAVDRVDAYLVSQGLTVTGVSANHQVVRARGSASRVAEALGTHERTYRDPQAQLTFFANDAPVSLPADVAAVVTGVSGLNNRTLQAPHTAVTGRNPEEAAPGSIPSSYGPRRYDGAYHLDRLGADGSGTAVALWEFDGYSSSDLQTYDSRFGLSGPAVTTVPVDGSDYDSAPGRGQVEVELDSEIVRGVAPKATQLIYEAPNSDQGEIDMAAQIVTENRVSVISVSWGSCEPDTAPATMASLDNAFRQAAAQGISVFSASGDRGSRDCTGSTTGAAVEAVDFPASDPYVTGTGGTTLNVVGDSYASESAWRGAGGGASSQFARPPWQRGTGVGGTMRTVPDVASDADASSPFAIFTQGTTGPAWQELGGTSAAAPLWSGFTALYDQKAAAAGRPVLGQANPRLYAVAGSAAHADAFHDVTAGGNQDFPAGPGYDQVTGWGSPNADRLAAALLDGDTAKAADPGYRRRRR